MDVYHIPGNEHDINELYVVLSKDEKGEGIVSMMTDMGAMPLVFGHKRMLEQTKEVIKKMAEQSGQTIRICKFKKSEVLEEILGSKK